MLVMPGKLASIITQALKTFNNVRDSPNVLDCPAFHALTSMVNNLQFIDIHREPDLMTSCEYALTSSNPLDYLPLYEDHLVTIGIFILKNKENIPLHDHPGMHGLLKVLRGELEITSYNLPSHLENPAENIEFFYPCPMEVTKNETRIVGARDNCCILTPTSSNIHHVHCVRGPAAFLDILAPPYSMARSWKAPRSCHYFEEVITTTGNLVKLKQIPNPEGF